MLLLGKSHISHTTMESDEETLAAVIAFVDAFNADATASPLSVRDSGSDSQTASTTDSEASRKSDKKLERRVERRVYCNRSRDRQKRELERLRSEAQELHEKLMQLQSRRSGCSASSVAVRSEVLRDEATSAWKRVATRQLRRRRAAEEENAQLKVRVAEQQSVVKTLQRIIQRHLAAALPGPSGMVPQWRPPTYLLDNRTNGFAELLQDLQRLQSSPMRPLNGSASLTDGPDIGSRVVEYSSSRIEIEVVNLRVVPFGFHTVGEAYWDACSRSECTSYDACFEKTEVNGQETIFRTQVIEGQYQVDEPSMRLERQASVQKCVKAMHTVIAIVARSNSVNLGGCELPGAKLIEEYQYVFQPREPDAGDLCRMAVYGRVILETTSHIPASSSASSFFTTCFAEVMHENVDKTVSTVEDMLLQRNLATA